MPLTAAEVPPAEPESTVDRVTLAEVPEPRATDERLEREIRLAHESPVVAALLEAVDTILVVLNDRRQVVAFSEGAARVAGGRDLAGQRLGEALACANAEAVGCGAAPACQSCGALGATRAAIREGRAIDSECLLPSVQGDGTLEFNVRASPLAIDGVQLTLLSLRDVSAEKRRDALEQVFLHDVLNTVTGLRGWTARLRTPGCNAEQAAEWIEFLTRRIEREIRDHRDLVLAESGELVANPAPLACRDVMHDVEAVFSLHSATRGRRLLVEVLPPDLQVYADASLLLRVLSNMVRNALEATPPGGTVRIRVERAADGDGARPVRFSVANAGVIPAEVQHRIFLRSFSTKAERGRGLGTYSMKLLGERHLGGEVGFVSAPEAGTVFWIRLPERSVQEVAQAS